MEPADRWIHTPPRASATFDEFSLAEIRRAAATGIYDIRGFGAKRRLPHFDDLLFLGRFGQPLSAGRLSRKMRHRRNDRRALRKQADHTENSHHDRGHELRFAVGARQGSARARRHGNGNLDHYRRWRHDARGARAFGNSDLSAVAVTLWNEPGRPAQGRRDRSGHRPRR